jgi:hypothetical protein
LTGTTEDGPLEDRRPSRSGIRGVVAGAFVEQVRLLVEGVEGVEGL